MAGGDTPVEVNRGVQWNWGTFNVPTIALCLTIAGMVYNMGGKQASTDAQITALQVAAATRSAEVNKVLEALQAKVTPVDNLSYRLTVAEQGLSDVNRRVDRTADSMTSGFDSIRKDIGELSTKFEVLNSKLQATFPSPGTPSSRLDR